MKFLKCTKASQNAFELAVHSLYRIWDCCCFFLFFERIFHQNGFSDTWLPLIISPRDSNSLLVLCIDMLKYTWVHTHTFTESSHLNVPKVRSLIVHEKTQLPLAVNVNICVSYRAGKGMALKNRFYVVDFITSQRNKSSCPTAVCPGNVLQHQESSPPAGIDLCHFFQFFK